MTPHELHVADLRRLSDNPPFLRFIFRVLDASNILRSTYGPDGRDLAYHEGRKALGLEILGWVESIRPDALIAVLTEENRTAAAKEPPHDRDDD